MHVPNRFLHLCKHSFLIAFFISVLLLIDGLTCRMYAWQLTQAESSVNTTGKQGDYPQGIGLDTVFQKLYGNHFRLLSHFKYYNPYLRMQRISTIHAMSINALEPASIEWITAMTDEYSAQKAYARPIRKEWMVAGSAWNCGVWGLIAAQALDDKRHMHLGAAVAVLAYKYIPQFIRGILQ